VGKGEKRMKLGKVTETGKGRRERGQQVVLNSTNLERGADRRAGCARPKRPYAKNWDKGSHRELPRKCYKDKRDGGKLSLLSNRKKN